jgi:hypothetical protein
VNSRGDGLSGCDEPARTAWCSASSKLQVSDLIRRLGRPEPWQSRPRSSFNSNAGFKLLWPLSDAGRTGYVRPCWLRSGTSESTLLEVGGSRRPTRTLVSLTESMAIGSLKFFDNKRIQGSTGEPPVREWKETGGLAINVHRATGRVRSDHVLER